MKYSSTVRMVNVVLFALLMAGFTFLAVWFGFLVTPFQWIGGRGSPLAEFPTMGYGLSAMLGAFGLAGAIVSCIGLVSGVQSLVKNDDRPVVRCFGCYIAVGLLVAAFLFFNATWLYRLTSSNLGDDDLGFIITVYVIAFILVSFATLVPLTKIFGDNEKFNSIMKILSVALCAADFSVALLFFLSYIQVVSYRDSVSYSANVMTEFGLGALIPFLACLLAAAALFGYSKADKNGQVKKLNGYLFEGALCLNGVAIIVAGVLEQIFQSSSLRISLVAKGISQSNPTYTEFAVMSYIIGGLLVLASLYFAYQTSLGNKAKLVKDE
ncbi:MAG: hypothetical protein IJU64_05070 [Bacilli bacterium]|nr:hypothetical protein [Bacilli bacterium]